MATKGKAKSAKMKAKPNMKTTKTPVKKAAPKSKKFATKKAPAKTKAKPTARPKMTAKLTPIPAGFGTVTPHLTIKNCAGAIEFYKRAFGAKELGRMPGPDGTSVMHATLQIGNSVLMMNDEFPEMGSISPSSLNGTPVTIHLYVENADAVFERAVANGARTLMPIQNTFWGDRYGVVTDPFGHQWSIATRIELVRPEEMAKRMSETMAPEPVGS